jgi:phosphatidate cytidylyltransferase
MKRLLTAAIGVPLALLAIFNLAPAWFFGVAALTLGWASTEFVRLCRAWAPGAPLGVLPPLAVALAALLSLPTVTTEVPPLVALGVLFGLSIGLGIFLLLARTPIPEFPAALGALAFGVPYFALPIAAICQLQRRDPWLVFLLLAIVWLGDTAAFYVGSRWGRRRMAPTVSPKKTWEGAVAGLLLGLIAAAVWGWFRLERVDGTVLLVALATGITAQLGDLVESVFKRSAGVKDSGSLLPGHGGVFDRADALLFAAPVLWLGLWLAGR